jgi:hypothetical protein
VDASNEVRVTTHSSPPKDVVNDTKAWRCLPQEALVDAFRSLAQHLTWADQHDAQLFDLFVELRVRGSTPDSVPRHTRTE